MPVISSGTFTLGGSGVSGGGNWAADPGIPGWKWVFTSGVPATGTLVFGFSNTNILTILTPVFTSMPLSAAPAGFTPTTNLKGNFHFAGFGSDDIEWSGHICGVAFGPVFDDHLTDPIALPDNLTIFDFETLADELFANDLGGGGTGHRDFQDNVGFFISGNYDILSFWWIKPDKDACGNPQDSQLQLSATQPDSSYQLLDPAHPTTAAPTVKVNTIEPAEGPAAGGTAVTIKGSGFGIGATVTFDGVSATSVVVVSQYEITCDSPAHAIGTGNVIVTNLDGTHN